MKREDAMQFSGRSKLVCVSIGIVEIMAMLDQLGAQGAHRSILLPAVTVRRHDNGS
jgi:hypothetical protein